MGRHVPVGSFVLFVATICGIAACSSAGPLPAEFVLGAMPSAATAVVPETGCPVVELKRIRLPDYLDTTDIVERKDNQLIASTTGRWGERLSIGITSALTDSLSARLPQMVVTSTSPLGSPARQILIDVTAFEAGDDHRVVLVANWTIADRHRVLLMERASLVEPIVGTGDGAIVTAMSRALDSLAARLATEIEHEDPAI